MRSALTAPPLPTAAPGRSHSLKLALLFVVCSAAVLTVPGSENPALYAIVAAMGILCFWPIWNDYRRGRFDPFATIHVMALRYFMFFGMGAIWTYRDPYRVAYDRYIIHFVNEATLYCLLGYAALLAGYYAPWMRRTPVAHPREKPSGLMFVMIPGAIGFIGSVSDAAWTWAYWTSSSMNVLVSSLGQLTPLYHFAWAFAWLMIMSGRVSRRETIIMMSLFVPATVLIMTMTLLDKSMAISFIAVPLVAWWYARRKLPWRSLLVLTLVMVFVMFPLYNTYRLVDRRLPLGKRLEATSLIVSTWDSEKYLDASATTSKARFAMINSVAVVVRDVGRWVPYENGKTILFPMVAFFVPRVLWPDKPWHRLGRDFGLMFRVVHILDEQTSISPTIIGELYWNFDVPGVIGGSAIWGMLMFLLYRRYGMSQQLDPVRHAIHILVLIRFAHFGSGIAADVVLLLRTLIVIEAYCWFARRASYLRRVPD